VEISNKFAALESLGVSSALEIITESTTTSAKENLGYNVLKHNKTMV
jgi:hypothetical protein